jgi:hypothetical protein
MSVRDQGGGGVWVDAPSDPSRVVVLPESPVKRPFGVIVASAVGRLRALARQHAELAKLEATEAATSRAQGAGMMGAAAVLAVLTVGFVAASVAAALALVMPVWAAILIVAVMLAVATGVLVMIGRRSMREAPTVERTKETLKEDARWAKRQIAR